MLIRLCPQQDLKSILVETAKKTVWQSTPSRASETPATKNSSNVRRYCSFSSAITIGTVKIMRIIESALGSIEKLIVLLDLIHFLRP